PPQGHAAHRDLRSGLRAHPHRARGARPVPLIEALQLFTSTARRARAVLLPLPGPPPAGLCHCRRAVRDAHAAECASRLRPIRLEGVLLESQWTKVQLPRSRAARIVFAAELARIRVRCTSSGPLLR